MKFIIFPAEAIYFVIISYMYDSIKLINTIYFHESLYLMTNSFDPDQLALKPADQDLYCRLQGIKFTRSIGQGSNMPCNGHEK